MKNLLLVCLLPVGLLSQTGLAEASKQLSRPDIPVAISLRGDAILARKKIIPVLLYFSDPQCGYCRKLEDDIFLPMLRSGNYEDRVLLRKISWLSRALVVDFDGSKREPGAIASRYGVRVTPTLVFVDDRGEEVAQRILGYNGPEFFWFYLDRAIDEAASRMGTVEAPVTSK